MRLLRHLFARSSGRLFPEDSLHRITEAIAAGERLHRGEVMFAVETNLPPSAVLAGVQARERAHEVFVRLRTWDTEANNGVLIYLLLADHAIEIVADRGLRARVDAAQWQLICDHLREQLNGNTREEAVLAAVAEVSQLLSAHFPPDPAGRTRNELPDRPQVFG